MCVYIYIYITQYYDYRYPLYNNLHFPNAKQPVDAADLLFEGDPGSGGSVWPRTFSWSCSEDLSYRVPLRRLLSSPCASCIW